MDHKVFSKWLEELTEACENIQNEDLCNECPMQAHCIEETSFADIAYECPKDDFKEIIQMGENPRWYAMSDDEKDERRAK